MPATDSFHSPWVYTMHRCAAAQPAPRPSTAARRHFLATGLSSGVALAAWLATPGALAQPLVRRFPRHALRGEVVFGAFPEALLNGQPVRLAPGARVRDADNRVAMPGAVAGGRFLVHYTVNSMGLLQDVWILRPDEAARQPWPRTPTEAATWFFDELAQVWTKP